MTMWERCNGHMSQLTAHRQVSDQRWNSIPLPHDLQKLEGHVPLPCLTARVHGGVKAHEVRLAGYVYPGEDMDLWRSQGTSWSVELHLGIL